MEEENLRLGAIDLGAGGFREVVEQRFETGGFLNRGVSIEHGVINKLLMRGGRGVVDRDAF